MKNKFPVAEIFDSIEGEGKRTGYMAVFVRFAGCNIRCTYCDTAYALKESDAEEFLTKEELLSCIRSYPWKRITLREENRCSSRCRKSATSSGKRVMKLI